MRATFHAAPLSPVPKTFRSALADPNWRAAMEEEHSALLKNHTWDLVPRPAWANVVTGKWISSTNSSLMALLKGTRHAGYYAVSLSGLVWTLLRCLVLW
jgi:hypothetical protein